MKQNGLAYVDSSFVVVYKPKHSVEQRVVIIDTCKIAFEYQFLSIFRSIIFKFKLNYRFLRSYRRRNAWIKFKMVTCSCKNIIRLNQDITCDCDYAWVFSFSLASNIDNYFSFERDTLWNFFLQWYFNDSIELLIIANLPGSPNPVKWNQYINE